LPPPLEEPPLEGEVGEEALEVVLVVVLVVGLLPPNDFVSEFG
jgi:hypothetical protein